MAPFETQLQTFHSFPNLPTELRLKIWLLSVASLPPRIINLQILYLLNGAPPLSPPSLLHTNQESRSIIQPTYQHWKRRSTHSQKPNSVTAETPISPENPKGVPYVYIDPAKDIFTLTSCDLNYARFGFYSDLALVSGRQTIWDVRQRVRHLVVCVKEGLQFVADSSVDRKGLGRILTPFTALETFDASVNGVVHAEGEGWRVEEHSGDALPGVRYVVEALILAMGRVEGLNVPLVGAVSIVKDCGY